MLAPAPATVFLSSNTRSGTRSSASSGASSGTRCRSLLIMIVPGRGPTAATWCRSVLRGNYIFHVVDPTDDTCFVDTTEFKVPQPVKITIEVTQQPDEEITQVWLRVLLPVLLPVQTSCAHCHRDRGLGPGPCRVLGPPQLLACPPAALLAILARSLARRTAGGVSR